MDSWTNPEAKPLSPELGKQIENDDFSGFRTRYFCPVCEKYYNGGGPAVMWTGGSWYHATLVKRAHNKCVQNGMEEQWFGADGVLIHTEWD